jgi:hypothetical protein
VKPTIAIVDFDAGISYAARSAVANAIQRQVRDDFAPHWLADADIRAPQPGEVSVTREWVLGLYARPDSADALGHHDLTPDGVPLIKVFPLLDDRDGIPWSVTTSHEILETLADPRLCRCVQVPDGRIAALEVCDPVEHDIYWIDGVAVSDFVLPAYFEPAANGSGPFDRMGVVKRPMELRPGGYNQFWSPTAGWETQTSMLGIRAGRMAMSRAGIGRGARRRAREGRAA